MIFREYDIRGVMGDTLTPEIAEQVGRAFASEMESRGAGQVIIGRDNRHSSLELSEALTSGIRAAGLDCVDIGQVATPMVYHASVTDDEKPAVMITGSHLPPDHNGFKMTQGLTPFYGDDIQNLRKRIEKNDFTRGRGKRIHDEHAASRYMADVAGRFGDAARTLKVVIDAGNGMAGMFAPTLLKYMRHHTVELYCEPDGSYPNHPADPFEEENLLDLKAVVLTQEADLGLAFDGDADRFGMVDGAGYAHPIDRLLIPLVWDVLKHHPGATIVTDPLVSQVLIDTIAAAGGNPVMWKSGHSNIKNKMKAEAAPMALETSGHVFMADGYYGYDDGIYTGLRMVELLSRERTAPLAEIMAEIPRLYTTPQFRPACAESKKRKVIKAVASHFADDEIIDVDGVRVVRESGWFIVRASNTEARLSLRFEGRDEDALNQMIDEVAGVLEENGVHLNGE